MSNDMELFKVGNIKPECAASCPIYQKCSAISAEGTRLGIQAEVELAEAALNTIDNSLTGSIEDNISLLENRIVRIKHLAEAGRLLGGSAENLMGILAREGCDGPHELSDNIAICTGNLAVKSAIAEVYEDMTWNEEEN